MKQITAVVVGAGLRGDVYSSYSLDHPDELKIIAVAEPSDERREAFAAKYGIDSENCFLDYKQLLEKPRMAEAAFICTMDQMHYEPVMMALERGYEVLCEKPMSVDEREIVEMGRAADKYQRTLSICHVLRYSPFFTRIKRLLDEGRIGQLITIQHIEEVGFWHQAHSFVRGNWRNTKSSSPMILQKCCHDMDIMLYLTGSSCSQVSSFGELTHFKEENAPEGAPAYCMDGCPHRESCPFYAPRFYLEHPRAEIDGLTHAVSVETDPKSLLAALKKGPYGRCVYHCDNDVVDHQVVNLLFENGVTANFTMSAFTNDCKRVINLMGTRGQLEGDMEKGEIKIYDFASGNTETITLHTPIKGHSGSDEKIVEDFVRRIAEGSAAGARSAASMSVESHLIALAAEKSRLEGKTISMEEYANSL